jgi:hypothetical protein
VFLGKIAYEFDENDRMLLRIASELLQDNAGAVFDTPEQQAWAINRSKYLQRLFQEK